MVLASTGADFCFVLNGERVEVRDLPPYLSLLDYIRSRGLTGAKEGCAEGECGACAVLFVRDTLHGTAWQPVNSCLVPLPMTAGAEVATVEALAQSGKLAEVQTAMIECGGSQCGYCTPGFIISMFAEQYRRENRPADPHSLSGNLCRCTGYRPIRDALVSLGLPPEGPLLDRLNRPAPTIQPFGYQNGSGRFSRPGSLEECLDLAAADDSAVFVAGNTDLGVMTNLHDRRFPHLIALDGVPDLRVFRDSPDAIEIGAGLTLTEIGESWQNAPEVFRRWLHLFASPLIRNRATLGGNLATASPIGDAAPLLLVLDSEVRIAGRNGSRTVPLSDFFLDYRQTVLTRGEILISIHIPKPLPSDIRFYKVAKRSVDDISTVAAAIAIHENDEGRIQSARVAFGGVAPTPMRAFMVEEALAGTTATIADLDSAKDSLAHTLKPIGDHRGSAEYRLALAQNLLDKFFAEIRGEI
jgi:xanthine dehydrogenase small subunit